MRKRPSDSLYRRLTPRERHRLAFDACGRGDWDEVRRLSDTCPEQRYWAQDPAYTERMKASMVVALAAANFLFRGSAALEPAVAAAEMNAAYCELLADEGCEAAAEELRHSEEALVLQRLYAARASELIGTRDGIRRFCDEIGVPPQKLLRLEPNCLPIWEFASELAGAHEPSDAATERVYEGLVAMWRAFLRVPESPEETSTLVA
jgi:hypothetical protein